MDLLSHPTSLHVLNIVVTEEMKNMQFRGGQMP